MADINEKFQWKCEPEAEKIILETLCEAGERNSLIADLAHELMHKTSTELIAWVDYVGVTGREKEIKQAGFVHHKVSDTYRHPRAQLPDIVIQKTGITVGIIVESIEDFLMVRGLSRPIEGSPFSGFRKAVIHSENGATFEVVERRGVEGIAPITVSSDELNKYFHAKTLWMTRPRTLEHEEKDFKEAHKRAKEIVDILGRDQAACLVLKCERDYWQARNTAGQIQKNRQDRLGMGWANHDHHTFRSSRKYFGELVKLFEILGFHCRERFYAGKEAGWGAQVMENPKAKLILFLDVDLSPEEIAIDFSHDALPELSNDGTIGLWCALHGESILKAGMHHLEAQFSFDHLKDDLKDLGIGLMEPFSKFPYLKQAFTVGEKWEVNPHRVDLLLAMKKITPEQAKKFLAEGALGSHMENLQRKEGYKGFNQKNVSIIIEKTDPRKQST